MLVRRMRASSLAVALPAVPAATARPARARTPSPARVGRLPRDGPGPREAAVGTSAPLRGRGRVRGQVRAGGAQGRRVSAAPPALHVLTSPARLAARAGGCGGVTRSFRSWRVGAAGACPRSACAQTSSWLRRARGAASSPCWASGLRLLRRRLTRVFSLLTLGTKSSPLIFLSVVL